MVICWRRRTQVWFKQDLRLDDHPGLAQAAAAGAPLAPLFCFDPALYAHLLRAPHGLEGALRLQIPSALACKGSTTTAQRRPHSCGPTSASALRVVSVRCMVHADGSRQPHGKGPP